MAFGGKHPVRKILKLKTNFKDEYDIQIFYFRSYIPLNEDKYIDFKLQGYQKIC